MSKEAALSMLSGTPTPVITEAIPAVAPPTEQPKPTELESTRFANYAKREAQLVKDREALKTERAKVEEALNKAKAFEEKKKSDPIAALKELGFSETDIFNFMAGEEKKEPTPEEIARRVAQEELKKDQDTRTAQQKEAQQKKDQELIDSYKKSIATTISLSKDKLKAAAHFGPVAEELAFLMAEEAVKGGQDAPSAMEAAEIVEEYYRWQFEDMKNIFEPTPVETPKQPEVEVAKKTAPVSNTPQQKPRTLTNQATATVASTVKKQETRSEKRERLMRQLAGN